jgi:hypothetical protein
MPPACCSEINGCREFRVESLALESPSSAFIGVVNFSWLHIPRGLSSAGKILCICHARISTRSAFSLRDLRLPREEGFCPLRLRLGRLRDLAKLSWLRARDSHDLYRPGCQSNTVRLFEPFDDCRLVEEHDRRVIREQSFQIWMSTRSPKRKMAWFVEKTLNHAILEPTRVGLRRSRFHHGGRVTEAEQTMGLTAAPENDSGASKRPATASFAVPSQRSLS